jgi:hypothetical protein
MIESWCRTIFVGNCVISTLCVLSVCCHFRIHRLFSTASIQDSGGHGLRMKQFTIVFEDDIND